MKTKYLLSTILLYLTLFSYAQVGIGTDSPNPNTTLDVNGIINISDVIVLGGNDSQLGNIGNEKEIIMSSGPTSKPNWKKVQIPKGFGESFTLSTMNTYLDAEGVDFDEGKTDPYAKDLILNSDWKELTGLENSFVINKPENKVNFSFQTVAQTKYAVSTSYACGIFLNSPSAPSVFRLKGVRTDVVIGSHAGNYKTTNMNITLQNLPTPNGENGTTYTAKIACTGRNIGTNPSNTSENNILQIGSSIDTSILTPSMAQSALSVFILESWN